MLTHFMQITESDIIVYVKGLLRFSSLSYSIAFYSLSILLVSSLANPLTLNCTHSDVELITYAHTKQNQILMKSKTGEKNTKTEKAFIIKEYAKI